MFDKSPDIVDPRKIIVAISLFHSRPKFFSMTETKHGYTLIVTDSDFQTLPQSPSLHMSGQLWRVLTVSVGAMGTNTELGGISKIAKSVIGPLADHEISVLCMSTYQSDFILVSVITIELLPGFVLEVFKIADF